MGRDLGQRAGRPAAGGADAKLQQALRLIVHASIGGPRVPIRISNELGTRPLRIGEAHVARPLAGADIVDGSDRPLTSSGMRSIVIPPGAPVLALSRRPPAPPPR